MRIEMRMSECSLAMHISPHSVAKEIYLRSILCKYYDSIFRNFLQEVIY
jgi:hypothetical protein